MNVDNFRLQLGGKEYVPIIIGGMGVNISTTELALAAEKLGGIGHVSDALVTYVCDRTFNTNYVSRKRKKYAQYSSNPDKSAVLFDLEEIADAQKKYIEHTISQKTGKGAIFLNCMEKLTMNNSSETLKVRLSAAMDAGVDGLTLAAGLNLRTLELIQDHPRFHDVQIGIIISSVRALAIFLKRAVRINRLPDYIIVEGPLAGGHLGFGADNWQDFDLRTIFVEVADFLKKEELNIPVIAAGGIFTGADAVEYFKLGAGAVQVATRFAISKEAGLPPDVKQHYINAKQEDIVVNMASTSGYPMRMLVQSPTLRYTIRPNCEGLGYLLENGGKCTYIDEYYKALAERKQGEPLSIKVKTCLCTGMANYDCWTCGQTTYRLKETTNRLANGKWQLPAARDIFLDYQFSTDHTIKLPEPDVT